jgi:hypothetical protein
MGNRRRETFKDLRFCCARHTISRPEMRRGVRAVEGARLESVCRGNLTAGSNPALSATPIFILLTDKDLQNTMGIYPSFPPHDSQVFS